MAATKVVAYEPMFTFGFEDNFDPDAAIEWMKIHWTDSYIFAVIYVIVIFSIKSYMKSRDKFTLRLPLAIWSGVLAVFSIMGALRTLPELLHHLINNGFEYTVCIPSHIYGRTSIWACLFVLSKVFELGDTLFIVLRKTPLIFLHWYHHITVLIYCWYTYSTPTGSGRWFIVMNYTVHSVMYSYYTLKTLRIGIPKSISMSVTIMQITQMVVGVYINYLGYDVKVRGDTCEISYENLSFGSMMYVSYFFLFGHFFYNAYFKPKSPAAGKGAKPLETNGKTQDNNNKIKKKM